ncbi:MAG: pilus assembly protein PilM [Dehalogenimonas sp.]|uniref:Pilus assembly protein PilM n=1 Tax=Candidatus Dehalogenimonas loeffleri TaxID=3127115 RepID=A0ABZ2J4I7_9CHLR|nr:pilus assembly protein PilM [Dehalogenimonas sp.]
MSKQVSLFIEDREIKLLVTNGKVVEKWASLMLDSGLVTDGVIQQEDTVAEILKNFMAEQELAGSAVVASLSGLNSIFRIISLPADVPKNILDDAIQNEATRVIPIPMDQVYLSRQLLSAADLEHRYFLVAYPKNATEALVRTVMKAGLKIKFMDVAPLALARLANVNRAVMVNTWLYNIDIIILVDRVPEVIRSFPLPSETMTDAERIMSIAEEISRTITFYNSSHTENPLNAEVPVLVSGGLTRDVNAWPALGGQEGHPVAALTTPFEAPEGFDVSQFIVNLGLVPLPKEDTAFGSVINVNVLPSQYLPKGINWFNILAPVAGVVLIGGLVYGWFLIDDFKTQNDEIQTRIDAVQTQVTLAQADIARIQAETSGLESQTAGVETAITPIITKTNSLEAQYQYMRDQREEASGDVRNAWIQIPSTKVTVDTIDWNDGVLSVTGIATESETNVFAYAAALRDLHRFENVIVSEITKELTEDTKVYVYNFTLILY